MTAQQSIAAATKKQMQKHMHCMHVARKSMPASDHR
jgi:hypothetical protein